MIRDNVAFAPSAAVQMSKGKVDHTFKITTEDTGVFTYLGVFALASVAVVFSFSPSAVAAGVWES